MNDPESLSQLLQVCARKTEDFVRLLDNKHMVWLLEIEEAAKKMFSSDFTAEPELMPKTPSQKRRRKKRTSIVPDENRDPNGRRTSRRRSSVSWSTSVRRLSSRHVAKPLNTSIQEESEQQPKRVTRAKAQASTMCVPVAEKPLEELSNASGDRRLQVKISAEDRRSAEVHLSEVTKSDSLDKNPALETVVPTTSAPPIPSAPPAVVSDKPSVPATPEKNGRTAAKLKIADCSTPKAAVTGSVDLTLDSPQPVAQAAKELALELSNYTVTPTGSKSDRRSVRRSIVGRKSISSRTSLVNQYSLASKRESMTREAVRKSIRRSVSRKKASDASSSSSYKSYQSSIEVVDEEVTVKIRPETAEPVQESPESPRRSLRTREINKIAISKQPETEPQRMVTRGSLTSNPETVPDVDDQTISRRKSYKRAVDELSDDDQSNDEQEISPPRKKTPSPPCPPNKVIKPPPAHMKTFLHTVQKNQLLMMTPGSIGKSFIAKSFIKRNTPLKVDPKEKERQRQEALRKKEEAELLRKQKIEEGKKRKQEELKLRREERLRKVLQARERVEQLEEEKKKKIEQKFAQIDEKSEKVKEDRLAEEKAKKKITAKKQEEVEGRRRQEEEARKLKAKQLEEEERRHQDLLQKKREEEEQERQRKLAEAKKLADLRQAELERERQLAAEKEQERLKAEKEKERIEKERALQLQRELERAAHEKERREAEERKRKQQRLEQERQERLRKEMEAKKLKELEAQKLREQQERAAKEKQAAVSVPTLNVTVDLQNSPACESYEMTPKGYKPPSVKINADDYGMDLNSDDSTDDESKPRKPIPAWASGTQLAQAMCQQYYHPIDVDKFYGTIDSPKLEDMFYKSKPRYYKRTSSAVWNSPPLSSNRQHLAVGFGLKKY
ncbi:inner centromere protein isoform 2-T2 [Leptodactylus fuscus]|uniref:inner centromere protein isoform X2 n=1 Tax=Leptodactylus fuscus TaxID=238119 RepID=UPI003F4E8CD1